jgi:MFS transporter, DHA1 family, inner membrane transport protein
VDGRARRHWRSICAATGLVPALTIAAFVNHLNVIAWNPFLPFIAEAHGIPIVILGQLPALLLVLSAVLGLVIGPIADSYGYRPTMVLSLVAVAASSLATGLSTMLPLLVLAALLGAVGRAAIMPVAQAVAAAVFVDDSARRRAVSRIQNGGPLAATFGIPLLTLIAGVVQRRGAFVLVSALALTVALILLRIMGREESPRAVRASLTEIFSAYRPVLRDRPSFLIVAAALENTGVNAMWTYYGAFYVQRHGFSIEQVGWVSLAAGFGVFLGQMAAGTRLGERPRALFIGGCAGSGSLIGLSVMLLLPATAAMALMATGWLLHGLTMVSAVVILVGQSPAGRATILTLYGSAMSFGMALGAVFGGAALAVAGYDALGVCTMALPIAAVVLVSFGRLNRRSAPDER